MADERWTIRGVPAEVQRAVAERAKAERRTVGELVTDALHTVLSGPAAKAAAEDVSNRVLERLEALERRLAALELRHRHATTIPGIPDGMETEDGGPEPIPTPAPSLALADSLANLVEQMEQVLGRGDPVVRLARRAAAGDRAAYRELTVAVAKLAPYRRNRLEPAIAAVDDALKAAGGGP